MKRLTVYAYGTYCGDELHVSFSARNHLPRAPFEAADWDAIEVDRVEILGLTVELTALPDELQDEIRGLAEEVAFEVEEPDCPDREAA